MTSLLHAIQAARRAVKRKAAAQVEPAEPQVAQATLKQGKGRASDWSASSTSATGDAAQAAQVTAAPPSAALGNPEQCKHSQDACTAREVTNADGGRTTQGPVVAEGTFQEPPLLPEPLLEPAMSPAGAPSPSAALPAFGDKEFYGMPRLKAVELRVQRFLSGVKQRLSTAGHPYELFPLQAQAFEYADAHHLGDLLRWVHRLWPYL